MRLNLSLGLIDPFLEPLLLEHELGFDLFFILSLISSVFVSWNLILKGDVGEFCFIFYSNPSSLSCRLPKEKGDDEFVPWSFWILLTRLA